MPPPKSFPLTLSERRKMLKKSVIIAGRHYTSISIEEEFWQELLTIADQQHLTSNQLITRIDANRGENGNLSSAVRIFVLNYLKKQRPMQ